MSGGKGGSKTQETTIPEWIRGPAARNLQRAEAVQQLEYMPYYGADVAAFTPAQNAAFNTNIGAAEAFGLLAPNTLTATSGMPTPTDFDGFSGYSSQPMYESAKAELAAKQPGAVAQYNALFGNATPAINWGNTGGSRFRGGASPGSPPPPPSGPEYTPEVLRLAKIWDTQDKERDRGTGRESGVTQAANYWRHASGDVNPQNKGKTSMGLGKDYAMSYNPLTGKGGF